MNAKLFSEAMSEVNDKYYEEAENYHCPKNRWIKFASLAACAAIVLAVSFATLWKQFPGQTMPQPDYNPPIITNPNGQSDNTEQAISLNINEIAIPDTVIGNINLSGDDFTAISYEELLNYFDVSLRFLYKGIIIKHNKTEPTYTKTSLFLCEKRRFFMARTEKGVVTTI